MTHAFPAARSGAPLRGRLTTRARGLIALLALAIVAFYFWTAQTPATPFNFSRPGYYSLLAEGFLSGDLAMKVTPDPELLKLKDPYDPEQSAQVPRLHDASLYRGKYYLYFGAAPALAWFLPWTVLTGLPCSENFADALLVAVGFVVWASLFRRIMRRHFPQAGAGMAAMAWLLAGLGAMTAAMLRRAAVWEVPIAGAYCFNALFCLFAYRAAIGSRAAPQFLALASLALGFSVGSRPGGVFMALGLGLLALWLARPRAPEGRWISRRTLALLAGAVIPVTACLAVILAYNARRFGSPTEFGTTYQLAGHNMRTWKMLDWANAPINLYHYFLSPAQFSVYFPFFEVIGNPPFKAPKDYYGVENVYGALTNLPVVLLGLAAAGAGLARGVRDRKTLGVFTLTLAALFLAGLPVLLRYAAAASRYMVDFMPWLIALALIGILTGEAALQSRSRFARRAFRAVWLAAAVYTVLFNVFVSLQHNQLLQTNNPPAFARLARFFDRASPLLERLTGDAHGPLELQLRLPKDRTGKLEPLVVTGLSFRADYVYLYYTDARHIQVGFEHTGFGGGVSQPIPVDYDAVQTIRVELGSFYPPETHPFFAGQTPEAVAARKRRLRIWVNRVPYRDNEAAFYESSPKDVVIGRDGIFGAFGPAFTGSILSVRRGAETVTASAASGYGARRLAVRFPVPPPGEPEPLLVTGKTGRGDMFYVSYVDAQSVRFTIDHWGFRAIQSEPVAVNAGDIHLLEIDLGSMHAPPDAGKVPQRGFKAPYRITLDRVVVMEGETDFHPSAAEDVRVGENPIGGSTGGPRFTGTILLDELR